MAATPPRSRITSRRLVPSPRTSWGKDRRGPLIAVTPPLYPETVGVGVRTPCKTFSRLVPAADRARIGLTTGPWFGPGCIRKHLIAGLARFVENRLVRPAQMREYQ